MFYIQADSQTQSEVGKSAHTSDIGAHGRVNGAAGRRPLRAPRRGHEPEEQRQEEGQGEEDFGRTFLVYNTLTQPV